jgi:superfamily II DNA or RNA helicase
VDLFNEGVEVPLVDTVLMLRPTDSPTLFLQQLGRGLRRAHGKTVCTVLDFVGHHRREFRFDRRLRALLPGDASGDRQAGGIRLSVPPNRLSSRARSGGARRTRRSFACPSSRAPPTACGRGPA